MARNNQFNFVFNMIDRMSAPGRNVQRMMRGLTSATNESDAAVRRFGQGVQSAGNSFSGFQRGVVVANQAVQLMAVMAQGIAKVVKIASQLVNVSDKFILIKARLDLANDGIRTTDELLSEVYKSSQRARGSFENMSAAVSKMGILAGEAFSGTGEIVKFTELIQKSFKIGGSSIQEQSAGMYQLMQAMAAGRLQGDEFRSILENAPLIADKIARSMGKTKGELKELSREGLITADIIKNSILTSAEDINEQFGRIPMTFGDSMLALENTAKFVFRGMAQKINDMFNTQEMATFMERLKVGLSQAAINLEILVMLGIKVFNTIGSWIDASKAFFNSVGIGAKQMLGIFYGTFELMKEGFKAVGRIVETTFSVIGATIASAIMGIVLQLKTGFFKVMDVILDKISPIVQLADTLGDKLGMNLGLMSKLQSAKGWSAGGLDENYKQLLNLPNTTKKTLDDLMSKTIFDGGKAFKTGAALGEGIYDGVVGLADGLLNPVTKTDKYLKELADQSANGVIDKIEKVEEVGKINSDINIAKEDIQLLRELAEQRRIQNFVTLTPNINTSIGNINENADADRLLSDITDRLINEINVSAKGVYR